MFYLIVIAAFLIFVSLVVCVLHYGFKTGKVGIGFAILLLLIAPFWEQLWGKWLMYDFARHNSPLQDITKTVEKPGSVLWIDNVWPGFDEKARAWMVETYLDGVHVQVLGLNDGEGNIYVYRATPEDFIESGNMRSSVDAAKKEYEQAWERAGERTTKEIVVIRSKFNDLDGPYRAKIRQEIIPIINSSETYSYDQVFTEFTYKVVFQPVQLSVSQKNYFWSDEILISEGKDERTIAFSKRCMGYSPRIGINTTGWPFYGGLRLGDSQAYAFDDKVLFGYAETYGGLDNIRDRLDR